MYLEQMGQPICSFYFVPTTDQGQVAMIRLLFIYPTPSETEKNNEFTPYCDHLFAR